MGWCRCFGLPVFLGLGFRDTCCLRFCRRAPGSRSRSLSLSLSLVWGLGCGVSLSFYEQVCSFAFSISISLRLSLSLSLILLGVMRLHRYMHMYCAQHLAMQFDVHGSLTPVQNNPKSHSVSLFLSSCSKSL